MWEEIDVVARAIKAGRNKTKNKKLESQDWQEFENKVKGKKLFLFGCGNGAEYFCDIYGKYFSIEGIVDNNKRKQGFRISDFISTDFMKVIFKVPYIMNFTELLKYSGEEIVILITSLVNYEEIADQLERSEIKNFFALLPMEAKKRIYEHTEESNLCKPVNYKGLPIENKKIVFYTMGGYSGHGRAIAEVLLRWHVELDMVWVVDDMAVKVPEGIKTVLFTNKKRVLREMATARCWVYDYLLPLFVSKRKDQIFIQTKHWSSITLKSFGYRLYRFRNDTYCLKMCDHTSKAIDYIFVGSKFDEETCREGFGFQGNVLYVGSPRSDILFRNRQLKEKIYDLYHIEQKYKLALFAPTFRCDVGINKRFKAGSISLDFKLLKEGLEKKFGGYWKILLRLHPNIAIESNMVKKPKYVIDVSAYAESEELVAASDIMITDYSSIMFEPAFVKKPVFLFAPDKNDYINGERELLIDYSELPFSIAESNEELVSNIENFEEDAYNKQLENFMDKYGVHEDGHASERAAKYVVELMKRKENGVR